MIASAALLLIFPASKDDGASFIDGWSWVIFGATLVASARKVNPILLIVLSGVAGVIIYGLSNI
jgi:chromate transporter